MNQVFLGQWAPHLEFQNCPSYAQLSPLSLNSNGGSICELTEEIVNLRRNCKLHILIQ